MRAASVVLAAITAALSALALGGWILHVEILKRLLPGLPQVKATTALCFLLASISLLAYSRSAPRSRLRRVAGGCAVVLVLVGAATLAEYVFGWRLGIDQLLFGGAVDPHASYQGRPSLNGALGLVLLGFGLLAWDVRLGRWWLTNVLAWLAAAVGLLALTGYATGARSLIVFTAQPQTALSSAVALILLPIAILFARPQRGEMVVLASDGQGGLVLRRLLPAAIALPVGLAALTMAGQRLGLFGATVAEWVFASAVAFTFAAAAWMIGSAAERAEGQRSRVERVMLAVAESASDAIVTVDATGAITYANPALESMFSYPTGEIVGQPFEILFPERDRMRRQLRLLVQSGDPDPIGRVGALTAVRSDGHEFPTEISTGVWEAQGELVAAGIIRDVSERRRAEDATARLVAIVESCPDAIIGLTADGIIESWNAGAEHLFGYVDREAIGQPITILDTPGNLDNREQFDAVLSGLTVKFETESVRQDGSRVEVGVTISPIRDSTGATVGVSCLAQDMNERKRAERELQRLAAAAQHGTDAVVSIDLDSQICHWNPGAELLYGWSASEAVARPLDGLLTVFSGESRDEIARMLAGEASYQFETQRRRKDATIIDVLLTVSPWTVDGCVVGVTSITVDVSEQRARERESERLAQAAEHGTDAVISIDVDGLVRHWNRGAQRLYGVTAEEAIGRRVLELTRFADGRQALNARMEAAIVRILGGESVRQVETQSRRTDGAIIDVLNTLTPWHCDGRVVGVTTVAIDISERKRVERAREHALAELEEAQRTARLGSWTWDPRADQANWSAQMYQIFGRDPTRGPASGEEFFAYLGPEDRGRVAAGYAQAFGGGSAFELDYRIVAGDGAQRTLHALGHRDPARAGCYVGTVQDVTELRSAEIALTDAEERFHRAFDEAPIGMALISADGRLEQANAALGVICGRPRDGLVGTHLRELLHPADADSASEALRLLVAGELEQLATELRIIPTVGSPVDISVHGTLLHSTDGQPGRLLCQFQDVTERKHFERQLQFMADHDPLTGLQNRRKFEAELDRHVAHVKRYGHEGALLVLDIDHFKTINDTLGHNAGDELIISIASVVRGRLRQSDVLARLGGDEFAVLLPKADEAEAAQVAGALVKAVRANTALLGGERRKVTTSIGVAMFNTNVEELTGETIVIEADVAMYDAKEAGRDGHAFYVTSEHRISRTKARLSWVSRIEQALDEDRFALLAQPILDLHSGEVRQHELLLRMLDGHDDLIPPASFLYIAERFGLIARLDQWVATRAIELIEQRPELQLEVNISGRSLGDKKLLAAIDARLRASSIDPARLIFEVTETAAVANITHAQAFAHHLRDRGCRFALDDFGAGFGSFYYLKHLPFDYVKIDGEFVQHATTGSIDQLVIEAVVRIAQGLGKETIAEFVTDEKTQQMVTRLGVDYAQGYQIGKPVPVAGLLAGALPGPDSASGNGRAIRR